MIEMDLYLVAVGLLGNNELTEERLDLLLGKLKEISGADRDVLETIRKQLESTIGVTMTAGEGLHGGEQEPWLEDLKADIDWHYWNAYKNLLKSNKMSLDVIRVIDEDTDNILNECGNPHLGSCWNIRGLVMGDVQSGKTANYCGLVNKAADAGYKVVVLLTGMIEELRAQSQGRLDEGFVGRDSCALLDGTRTQTIGAGRFRTKEPNVLTSVSSDFLVSNARTLRGIPLKNISEPVLVVMKKNKSPLENMIGFIEQQLKRTHGATQLDLPLLLIDDEADNASVNSKKDDDPTTINRLIREIISKFTKSTYVAYTATPFANVFINPDYTDLFPANFVYSLNTPTNYIGATSVFSETGSHQHQLVDIEDADSVFPYGHKKEHPIETLPISLQEAIGTFLISCCLRDSRKEPLKHRSMLVNVSRFTDVQSRLSLLIKQHLYNWTEEIKQYLAEDNTWQKHKLLVMLHGIWEEHYSEAGLSWDQIRKTLYESIASIKVLTINKDTDDVDRLNYNAYKNSEKGRRAIVVGGLTLSRGLTLEGLCVSYFYRNSKAYDTLLQMGRWFGYRPGYDDLCRIWMDPRVQEWFAHLADIVTELRFDIKRMHANRQPPERFGMRVRSHPGTLLGKLIVTATNKMRNAQEVEHFVSYSGYGAETSFLPKCDEHNRQNIKEVAQLINSFGVAKKVGSRCIWRTSSKTVATFLRRLNISNMNMEFISDMSGTDRPLFSFISENSINMLENWDVCLAQGDGATIEALKVPLSDGSIVSVKCRNRQFEKVGKETDYLKVNKHRVGDISDEMVELTTEQVRKAELEWESLRKSDPENHGERIPGRHYRQYRQSPLLTIHVIQPSDPESGSKHVSRMMLAEDIESKAIVAISLSFPKYEDNDYSLVRYRLNLVALRKIGLIDVDEESSDDED